MKHKPLLVLAGIILLCASLLLPGGHAADKPAPRKILVVGFGPFGGRKANASSLAAQGVVQEKDGVTILSAELPVVWGSPVKQLAPLVEKEQPDILICLGEGYPGFFTLEAVGRNQRAAIKDVEGNLPLIPQNQPGGPAERKASAPLLPMAKALSEAGFATHISTDAGRYLCDEALYTIEGFKERHTYLKLVVFSHMPPLDKPTFVGGKAVRMDAKLATLYAEALVKVALETIDAPK